MFVSSGVEALNHTGYGINHGHLLQQWQGEDLNEMKEGRLHSIAEAQFPKNFES